MADKIANHGQISTGNLADRRSHSGSSDRSSGNNIFGLDPDNPNQSGLRFFGGVIVAAVIMIPLWSFVCWLAYQIFH